MVSKSSSILVGSASGTIWMRVEGRGTFENCQGLKEFSRRMISKGHTEFILDLEKCELMDSTFMGTLAALAFSLRDSQGRLRVVRANTRNFSLLESLGLDNLFAVEPEPSGPAPAAFKKTDISDRDSQEARVHILEAHEALIEADPRNAVRFQDVIEFLKSEAPEA